MVEARQGHSRQGDARRRNTTNCSKRSRAGDVPAGSGVSQEDTQGTTATIVLGADVEPIRLLKSIPTFTPAKGGRKLGDRRAGAGSNFASRHDTCRPRTHCNHSHGHDAAGEPPRLQRARRMRIWTPPARALTRALQRTFRLLKVIMAVLIALFLTSGIFRVQ